MTPEVEVAVDELRRTFSAHRLEVIPEVQGGAYVFVHEVGLGERYVPAVSWFGFLIAYQYPHADVYPHFISSAVRRVESKPLGPGFSGPLLWQDRDAIQVSRRSSRWNPAVDTATGKLLKVIEWVNSQ
jgi:hypothetical protein